MLEEQVMQKKAVLHQFNTKLDQVLQMVLDAPKEAMPATGDLDVRPKS